ncbi:hypothetical protein TRAPUB_972 [Trametes pubescens]|uniref:Uncharacterized protein n=1 Tax=Trametes pubescens TaxID=154538 RepID=A0A1M2VKM3_TRAPU|nr:hypothetical protein TRAPUB_972 [Trametes pubescens]
MALFIFTYVGVEVTIGGWIVTYVINERHGGANSGYISSGFFGDLLAGAISVSFVGFFLGPIYPIVMNHAGAVLPPELISGGVGWIASFGGAGAAVFPFIAGAIASRTSIASLQPL